MLSIIPVCLIRREKKYMSWVCFSIRLKMNMKTLIFFFFNLNSILVFWPAMFLKASFTKPTKIFIAAQSCTASKTYLLETHYRKVLYYATQLWCWKNLRFPFWIKLPNVWKYYISRWQKKKLFFFYQCLKIRSNSVLDTYPNIAVTQPNTVLAVIKLGHCSASTKVIFQGPEKIQENEVECTHRWGKVYLDHFIANTYVFKGINNYK